MNNSGTKYEKGKQGQEMNSHVDRESNVQEEKQMLEEEVKIGVEFWNNGTDVTI